MKKIIIGIMLVVLTTTLIISYASQKSPQEPPGLVITIDGRELEYITSKNKWKGAVYDREDTFKAIMKEGSGIEIPYIKPGKTLNIEFKQNPPKTVQIFDYLLNEKGENRYTAETIMQIPVNLKKGKCSFEFNPHMASFLSSNSEDYKEGRTIRGFKIICRWGNGKAADECEYGFIIRTDANK